MENEPAESRTQDRTGMSTQKYSTWIIFSIAAAGSVALLLAASAPIENYDPQEHCGDSFSWVVEAVVYRFGFLAALLVMIGTVVRALARNNPDAETSDRVGELVNIAAAALLLWGAAFSLAETRNLLGDLDRDISLLAMLAVTLLLIALNSFTSEGLRADRMPTSR